MIKRILVTGNQGYIGTVLMEELIKENFDCTGLDIGYFEECFLSKPFNDFKQIKKDIRNVQIEDLKNLDAVIHLSALSNDPLGEFDKSFTNKINFISTVKLAKLSKKAGIKRFIYASSQSMYGISDSNDELDEYNSKKNPITEYARTKWEAEKEINKLVSKNFLVVSFRPSTVFGSSPRLRCDIVYNNFLASAFTSGKIVVKSDGSPVRPAVHIKDVCNAFISGLKAPENIINGKVFNVGVHNGNYSVKNLALAAQKIIPGSEIVFTKEHGIDSRTYKVSFKRILLDLGNFYKPRWNIENGGLELIEYFKKVGFNEAHFKGFKTNRLNQLKKLIKDSKIDQNFNFI